MAVATAQIDLLPTLESAQDVTGPFAEGDTLVRKGGEWVAGRPQTEVIRYGGTFGLQNNEVNAVGVAGIIDTNHTQDLGNSGAMGTPTAQAILNANAGGFMMSYQQRIVGFRAVYRQNNIDASEWGFLLFKQTPAHQSNVGNGALLYDDVALNINRVANANNVKQVIHVTSGFEPVDIMPGDFLVLAARCPTSAANRNLQLASFNIELEYTG